MCDPNHPRFGGEVLADPRTRLEIESASYGQSVRVGSRAHEVVVSAVGGPQFCGHCEITEDTTELWSAQDGGYHEVVVSLVADTTKLWSPHVRRGALALY
jgi:hypothetical protein